MPSNGARLRFCHLADTHLGFRRYYRLSRQGFNQRELDVSLAFREAVQRICSLSPHIVLIAGDLFHTVRPSNAVLRFAFRQVRELAKNCPVIIVAGNHESPKRSDTGSPLRLLGEIPNVYIADSQRETFSFPALSLSVCCLPHRALPKASAKDLRADDRFRFNLLVTHGQIGEACMTDFGGSCFTLEQLQVHEWDYVALGHVHSYTRLGQNVAYSGSTEYTSNDVWRESSQPKGFLEVELPEVHAVFHELNTPREILVLEPVDGLDRDIEEINREILQRLDGITGGIDGKVVRLELLNLPRHLFRHLDHRSLRSFRARALNLSIDLRPGERLVQEGRTSSAPARGSLFDELQQFADNQSYDKAVVDLLTRLRTSLEEVHEAH